MSKESNASVGIGFDGLLCIVFITLKLTGFIFWSWWWVLAPIWLPIAVIILVVMIVATLAAYGAI